MDEGYFESGWKKNIALLLAGQAATLIGSSLVSYAIMWYITLKTQSGSVMTLFVIATMLPMFFISPFGGVWADRFNRKYIIALADASIAVITLAIAVCFSLGIESIALIFACSVMRSLGQGVQMPAITALLPELVPKDQLMRINGINASIQSLSTLGSPALAGLLLTFAPIQTIFFIDVATAAIGISILLCLVKTPVRSAGQMKGASSQISELKEGLRYILGHSFVKRFFLISACFSLLVTPGMFLSVLQVTRNFGPDVWRLSAIEFIFSLGMLLGGVLIAAWGGLKNKTHTSALGIFTFGVACIGLGLCRFFPLYLVCMAVAGLTFPITNTPITTIFQTVVDPDYMGRVLSILTMIASLVSPLGMLVFGPLGDVISIDIIMIFSGCGTALLGIYMIFDKVLRAAGA